MLVLDTVRRFIAGLAFIGMSLALAGCTGLPKPFAHDGPSDSPLLRLGDGTGIVVMPSAFAPPDTSEQLADAVAAALGDANIPASVAVGHQRSYRLESHANVRKLDDWREEILLYWELRDGDGRRIGNLAQTFRALGGRLEPGLAGHIECHCRRGGATHRRADTGRTDRRDAGTGRLRHERKRRARRR